VPRRRPYDNQPDFYLVTLWQGRDGLGETEREELRVAMLERGLDLGDSTTGESDPYATGPAPAVGTPCPTCGQPMREGKAVARDDVWFRPFGGRDEDATIAFKGPEKPRAALCEGCGTLIVPGRFAAG